MQPSKTFVPDPLLNLPPLKFIPTVWEGEENLDLVPGDGFEPPTSTV